MSELFFTLKKTHLYLIYKGLYSALITINKPSDKKHLTDLLINHIAQYLNKRIEYFILQ